MWSDQHLDTGDNLLGRSVDRMSCKRAILIALAVLGAVRACPREPFDVAKQPGDNGFRLVFSEDALKYTPGKIYNLFLLGNSVARQTFNRFSIQAQSANADTSTQFRAASPRRVGRFQLFSDVHAKFDEHCVNRIVELNDETPKTEIQVMWVAPKAGSGCVAVSASVWSEDQSGVWYGADGDLVRVVCEATAEDLAAQKAQAARDQKDECCACDEAKYEFVFEGIWSNETHPRDYPFAVWLTHFSDVIGATHESNFSFWGANHIATDGFRSLAEWGSIRLLETELRAKGSRMRTLVKAAGLWYPSVNTNTTAAFRVDRVHHKLSLVSMFGPSPDWVVGVSGLNLCRKDCSWTDSMDIDLYPWDAGTDNGISYMSPNAETQPRERMYPITTMYPEDPRAPFYNPTATSMTPLAKLYIRKTKQFPRECGADFLQAQILDVNENAEDDGPTKPECEVLPFGEWTPCSVSCGKGIRMRSRVYRNEALAKEAKCGKQLINKEMCVADIPECDPSNTSEPDDTDDDNLAKTSANVDDRGEGVGVCRTTPWAEWSPCSVTCGIGISMRTRTFVQHAGRKKCPHITVVEKEKCMLPECSASEMETPDPECPVTVWSDWSPCSQSCGEGVRIRARQLLVDGEAERRCRLPGRKVLYEQQACRTQCAVADATELRAACALPRDAGPCRGSFERYAFDATRNECGRFMFGGCRGNANNFMSLAECRRSCIGDVAEPTTDPTPSETSSSTLSSTARRDCQLTEWSEWSPCSASCGLGLAERNRRILAEARNGGTPCPVKLVKRRRCFLGAC